MGWQWHQPDHMQVICTSLQTDNHASTSSLTFLPGWMSFLPPNQQRQSRDMKGVAKCRKWGWFGVVMGYSWSSVLSPFDRAHMSAYSSLTVSCVYLVPFSRYSEFFVEIRQLLPTPPAFGTPHWGWPRSNFTKIFGIRKLEFLDNRVAFFACSYV